VVIANIRQIGNLAGRCTAPIHRVLMQDPGLKRGRGGGGATKAVMRGFSFWEIKDKLSDGVTDRFGGPASEEGLQEQFRQRCPRETASELVLPSAGYQALLAETMAAKTRGEVVMAEMKLWNARHRWCCRRCTATVGTPKTVTSRVTRGLGACLLFRAFARLATTVFFGVPAVAVQRLQHHR
jgi:hypothetical protein